MGEDRAGRKAHAKREAAKHVDSFGVDLWIRVRFPAPPPNQWAVGSEQWAVKTIRNNPQITQ